jgi:hypothetical protein
MKQIILSLLLIGLFSCTKDHTPTLAGKWKLKEIYDCTGGAEINNDNPILQFKKNGDFTMAPSNKYPYLMSELKGLDRYMTRYESILFYKQNTTDTITYYYDLEDELCLSFGYGGYKFSH